MKFLIFIPVLFFTGCASFSTKFEHISPDGSKTIVYLPKEVDGENIELSIDPSTGVIKFTAEKWSSRNAESIVAQGEREEAIIEKSAVVVEKAVKGAVEGAMKGVVPIP